MDKIWHPLAHAACYLISRLPYGTLYACSGLLYVMMYRIMRHRRATVRKNLAEAFPELTPDGRKDIERKFYRWLCDYMVETVKMLSVSRDELMSHIEFRNMEEIERRFDRGQTCAVFTAHYCNWELLSAAGTAMKRHREAVCGLIYHPMSSKLFDRIFIKIRQNMGGVCVPDQDILRYLTTFRQQGLMNIFGYMADQSPDYANTHLWLPFLNHDTPVFTGAERIMRKMGNAVFYADLQRPHRGKYVCTFRLITDNPGEMEEHGITRRYFSMLEENVRRAPEFYLWTDDRWRHTHEEFDRHYRVENGRVIKKQENR